MSDGIALRPRFATRPLFPAILLALSFLVLQWDQPSGAQAAGVVTVIESATPKCDGRPATIVGTLGDDTIMGTAGADVIVGLAGDDEIKGLGGDDLICGGPGRDQLVGHDGHDIVFGGDGPDRLWGKDGMDELHGGADDDVLYGGDEDDSLWGGEGNDRLKGEGGSDEMHAGPGNDTVDGGDGNDEGWGDEGDDRLYGREGDDAMHGGPGLDVFYGGPGDDRLLGDENKDRIKGEAGTDHCEAGPSGDGDTFTGCEVEIHSSDNRELMGRVSCDPPQMWTVEAGGEMFTQVQVPGIDVASGAPGMPGVPVFRQLVAVPRGAEVNVSASTRDASTFALNLYPFQRQPVDQTLPDELPPPEDIDEPPFETFLDFPFVKNEKVYSTDAVIPSTPCTVSLLGQYRDLPIAQLECAAARYNPVTDEFTLYDSVEYEVSFGGGSGAFLTSASMSPFESAPGVYMEAVVNRSVIHSFIDDIVAERICFGEELLILTHPDFRDAADLLAEWKRDKGILTSVFEVNDGGGPGPDTEDEIDDFIEERFNECLVRLSYVLLYGDAEFIPTFYAVTVGSDTTGSDYAYSVIPQFLFDILPDVGVGRIPVDTLGQATTVANKVINYESDPPVAPSFYQTVSLAAEFQCCRKDEDGDPLNNQPGTAQRTFTEVSEFVRSELLTQGYTVERIYEEKVDGGKPAADPPVPGYLGNTTPRRYYDGTFLPADLGPGSGFAWDGSTQDVIDAFNEGRFLVQHRDHGWVGGWSTPRFNWNHIGSLNNGELLPVMFSVNCASGLFDNETAGGDYDTTVNGVYFGERMLRKSDGGVVCMLGDTRNSPSWPNTALSKGFFDAVWPNTLPAFGGAASHVRLGDMLNHGKMFMLTQIGVAGAGVGATDAVSELLLWHALGDPTLEMWTENPNNFILVAAAQVDPLPDFLRVAYEVEGATLTAYQEVAEGLLPIGRAVVEDGVAVLPYVERPRDGVPILLSASMQNAVSVLLTPRAAQPADLQDESAFGAGATRITFDPKEGRTLGEHVSDQYSALGVLFVDDDATTPLIVNDTLRGGTTHSSPYSLSNDADTVLPGSADLPMTMDFTSPVRRVGMYIGNGGTATTASFTTATLSAFDSSGQLLFSVSRQIAGDDVQTFIGLDAGMPNVAQVRLDYGNTLLSEEIDDLLLE